MVGNGHSVSVAAEIFENMLRSAKWAFTVNDPMVAVDVANESMKRLRIREMFQFSVETDLAFRKSFFEGIYNFPSKDLPQCTFRQKEPVAGIRRHPALMIKR